MDGLILKDCVFLESRAGLRFDIEIAVDFRCLMFGTSRAAALSAEIGEQHRRRICISTDFMLMLLKAKAGRQRC